MIPKINISDVDKASFKKKKIEMRKELNRKKQEELSKPTPNQKFMYDCVNDEFIIKKRKFEDSSLSSDMDKKDIDSSNKSRKLKVKDANPFLQKENILFSYIGAIKNALQDSHHSKLQEGRNQWQEQGMDKLFKSLK